MAHFEEAFRLSYKDYFHEWRISGAYVLALAAVLGPMLVLFGLKFGIIGSLIDELVQDPRNREIRTLGSGRFGRNWMNEMAKRPNVAFIVPRTRRIAANMQISVKGSGKILNVELIPSGEGDPLLADLKALPSGTDQVVISQQAATQLRIKEGDVIDGSIGRHFSGKSERQHLDLRVVAVAPSSAFNRIGAFVSVSLLEAVEDFRDGRKVESLGWSGNTSNVNRVYPGFRLYAKSIYDVRDLSDELTKAGLNIRTRAREIAVVQDMDSDLTILFWAIAVIGLTGFSLSLGASLLANIDRKRKELSVLRLSGFHTGDIVLFPMLQATYTAVLGWILAIGIFYGVSYAINLLFADQLKPGSTICRLLPEHFLISLVLIIGAAVLAAILGGLRAARIEPSEGLREI